MARRLDSPPPAALRRCACRRWVGGAFRRRWGLSGSPPVPLWCARSPGGVCPAGLFFGPLAVLVRPCASLVAPSGSGPAGLAARARLPPGFFARAVCGLAFAAPSVPLAVCRGALPCPCFVRPPCSVGLSPLRAGLAPAVPRRAPPVSPLWAAGLCPLPRRFPARGFRRLRRLFPSLPRAIMPPAPLPSPPPPNSWVAPGKPRARWVGFAPASRSALLADLLRLPPAACGGTWQGIFRMVHNPKIVNRGLRPNCQPPACPLYGAVSMLPIRRFAALTRPMGQICPTGLTKSPVRGILTIQGPSRSRWGPLARVSMGGRKPAWSDMTRRAFFMRLNPPSRNEIEATHRTPANPQNLIQDRHTGERNKTYVYFVAFVLSEVTEEVGSGLGLPFGQHGQIYTFLCYGLCTSQLSYNNSHGSSVPKSETPAELFGSAGEILHFNLNLRLIR